MSLIITAERSGCAKGKAMEIRTNHDLYDAICALAEKHAQADRLLEAYLSALWQLGGNCRQESALTVDQFFQMLSEAFVAPVPNFDETWRSCAGDSEESEGFTGWEVVIQRQIVDLREMDEAGLLQDKYRELGLTSPRGRPWFNFDPCSYLQCGTQAILDSRQAGDTGSEIDEFEVTAISWELFREFSWCGQIYE